MWVQSRVGYGNEMLRTSSGIASSRPWTPCVTGLSPVITDATEGRVQPDWAYIRSNTTPSLAIAARAGEVGSSYP